MNKRNPKTRPPTLSDQSYTSDRSNLQPATFNPQHTI